YFSGWVDPVTGGAAHGDGVRYNGIVVHLGPNTATPQAMHDLVFQNNTVVDGEKLIGIGCYDDLIIRNHLLWTDSPWTEGHIYFSSHQNFDQRPMKNIQVYDNLVVKDAAPTN